MSSNQPDPLFPVRTALVLLFAAFAGCLAGVLTFFASRSLPAAALAGGSAGASGLLLAHTLIGK